MRKRHVHALHLGLGISLVASLAASACGGRATEEDCKKFTDNFVSLMTRGQQPDVADIATQVAEGMRVELLKFCNENGTKAEVECGIAAQSMEEFEKCADDPPAR